MKQRDNYPSRVSAGSGYKFLPRIEPASYGGPGYLTPEQLTAYSDNGFLVLDGFFRAQLPYLSDAADDLFNSPPESAIIEPNSGMVRSVFAVHSTPSFRVASYDERLLSIARQIVGDTPYMHQSRINYKAPLGSTGWMWHSDFETWHTEDGMPGMRCFTAMIPLTDNVSMNGPLMVIPGSHKRFLSCPGETPDGNHAQHLRDQKIGIPDRDSLLEMLNDSSGIKSIECNAGALVLFDCNIMHGSNSNVSPFWRKNLFLVYNAVSNAVVDPFCGKSPRPEYACSRTIESMNPVMA